MPKEKQRMIAIINEVMNFLLNKEIESVYLNIEKDEEMTLINFYCPIEEVEILHELKEKIGLHRNKEIEELYWGLLGDSNTDDELYLLGNMIDKTGVDYVDSSIVKITLARRRVK